MEDPNKIPQMPSDPEPATMISEAETVPVPQQAETKESQFSLQEQALIEALRVYGFEHSENFAAYDKAQQAEIDELRDPSERKAAQEKHDIRKAILVGVAGNLNYADEHLFTLGKMAFETGDRVLEEKVNDAMDFLGLE